MRGGGVERGVSDHRASDPKVMSTPKNTNTHFPLWSQHQHYCRVGKPTPNAKSFKVFLRQSVLRVGVGVRFR